MTITDLPAPPARWKPHVAVGLGAVLAATSGVVAFFALPDALRPGLPWLTAAAAVLVLLALGAAALLLAALDRRDEAEASERRISRKLQDVIDISNDVYVEFDTSLRIVEISSRIETLVGLGRESFIGLRIEDLRGDPAESEGRTIFWQAVAERRPFQNIFAPIMLPNGNGYWVKGSGRPMFDERGAFSGYRCMVFGLPETEVRGSSQAHQDRMSALGQLAGGIAHDFNNLLAAILGFATLLEEDLKSDGPKLKLIQRVLTSTNRAKDLVQRILSFARLSPGATEYVEIGAAVQDMIPLLRSSMPTSTRLEVLDDTGGEIVRIDKAQLGQIVVSLCTNANDALGGRDGVLSLSIAPAEASHPAFQLLSASKVTSAERYTVMRSFEGADRILVGHVTPGERYVRLSMTDTGGGIDPKVLTRVFEPYFTTKKIGKGGGLGLSIVHGVVLGTNGALAVSSRRGEGTSVDLFLPVVVPVVTADEPAKSGELVGSVLVVDDEREVREMIALTLERRGMTVLQCADGAEALAAFEADASVWDAVVTDYGMPAMRGDALIRRIKALVPDMPCVLCTGFSESLTDAGAQDTGADAFLLKPMEPSLLQRTVAQLISIKRASPRP